MDIYCKICKLDYLNFEERFARTSCGHLLCLQCTRWLVDSGSPCKCGQWITPFKVVRLREIHRLLPAIKRLYHIATHIGRMSGHDERACQNLARRLQTVVMSALQAWADYVAYIEGLRVSWKNERLDKDFQKGRYVDELRMCLENLADEYNVAVWRLPESFEYSAELCAIFPNKYLRFGHFQRKRVGGFRSLLNFSNNFKII